MPSPFPGMDPYLEHPTVWPGMHGRLIARIATTLLEQLRPRGYYVDIGERIWLEAPGREVYPDIVAAQLKSPRRESGGTATLTVDEPVRVSKAEVELRQAYIEVFEQGTHQIVAGIEILSHANKVPSKGRKLYLRKQKELRQAGIHLVEIDLLRAGKHVLAVPLATVEARRPWDYLVNIGRCGGEQYEFYPIGLRDVLPRVRIPLKSGDEDGSLDLQQSLNTAYEVGPYPERLDDYSGQPLPPLRVEYTAWAEELLMRAGFRSQPAANNGDPKTSHGE